MSLKSSYSGTTYAAIDQAIFADVDANNGNVLVPLPDGDAYFPRLTNGQAVSLIAGWRRAAARSPARVTFPLWWELSIAALGFMKPGDRFDMSATHAKDAAPPWLLPLLWRSIEQLVEQLDASNTIVRPVPIAWTMPAYEQAARDSWEVMKRDCPTCAQSGADCTPIAGTPLCLPARAPATTDIDPSPPEEHDPPKKRKPVAADLGALLLLIVGALLFLSKGRDE